MTITATTLDFDGYQSGNAVSTTSSITPASNTLILLCVGTAIFFGTPNQPTVSGCGMTWHLLKTQQYNGNSSRLSVFYSMSASPTTDSLTIDWAAQTQDTFTFQTIQWDGVLTSGVDGADALGVAVSNSASSATPNVTLATFADPANATFGFTNNASDVGFVTPGTGFTEIQEINTTGAFFNDITFETQWQNAADTVVDWSLGSTIAWGAIAVEIKGTAAGFDSTSGVPWKQVGGEFPVRGAVRMVPL